VGQVELGLRLAFHFLEEVGFLLKLLEKSHFDYFHQRLSNLAELAGPSASAGVPSLLVTSAREVKIAWVNIMEYGDCMDWRNLGMSNCDTHFEPLVRYLILPSDVLVGSAQVLEENWVTQAVR
jgi:hypothetical protein